MKKLFSKLFFKYLATYIGVLLIINITATLVMVTGLVPGDSEFNPFRILIETQPAALNVIKFFIIRTQAAAFFIGVIFIFVLTLSIIRPIKRLNRASKKVTKGDFSIEIPEKGHDEIAELTHNFNIMVKELSANEYLHKDFVSNVSHEFKTPITSLKGYAKLLKEPNISPEKQLEYFDIIISESERLSNLSTNLLKLSELENNALGINKEMFSLDEQIRDTLLLLQYEWEKKGLELDIELDEIVYIGDKALIYQMWVNLISNAIKYSNDGGSVKITLRKKDKIEATISDNGIGMSKEDTQNIFRRFYKADKSRNTSGTGLGLSIVQRIVELHGGNITVDSELGKGSSFVVAL